MTDGRNRRGRKQPESNRGEDTPHQSLDELIEIARAYEREYNATPLSCALIGQSGTGKSALINAIAGERVASVGETETTQDAQRFHCRGIDYIDMPGCGTNAWPTQDYVDRLDLHQYDMFILNLDSRVSQDDTYLFEELVAKSGKPCFITRNLVDFAVANEAFENNLSEEQTLAKIRAAVESHFPGNEERIYLISARYTHRYDFSTLMSDLIDSMAGIKKDKAIAGMTAVTDDGLSRKRALALKRVHYSAAISAASNATPIPLLGIAADIKLMQSIGAEVRDIFGLNEAQLQSLERGTAGLAGNKEYQALKNTAFKLIAKHVMARGIRRLLLTEAGKRAPKLALKFVPFVGNATSFATSYLLTWRFGSKYVSSCHDLSARILHQVHSLEAD